MAATTKTKSRYSRIWAGAREAGLSSDAVHDLVSREYGKESLKELTDKQVDRLGDLIWGMATGRTAGRRLERTSGKRTDEGGREDNVPQRRKIFKLAQELGWSEDDVNAFCFKQYGISRQEWMPPVLLSNMINALDSMAKRPKKTAAQ
jgi:hypothetical protein